MTTDMAIIISCASLAFAIYQGITNNKRTQKIDNSNDASQLTTVIVKLESIGAGIVEIKSEMSSVKKDFKEDHERLVKVEEAAKAAKDWILAHEKNCKGFMTSNKDA